MSFLMQRIHFTMIEMTGLLCYNRRNGSEAGGLVYMEDVKKYIRIMITEDKKGEQNK